MCHKEAMTTASKQIYLLCCKLVQIKVLLANHLKVISIKTLSQGARNWRVRHLCHYQISHPAINTDCDARALVLRVLLTSGQRKVVTVLITPRVQRNLCENIICTCTAGIVCGLRFGEHRVLVCSASQVIASQLFFQNQMTSVAHSPDVLLNMCSSNTISVLRERKCQLGDGQQTYEDPQTKTNNKAK